MHGEMCGETCGPRDASRETRVLRPAAGCCVLCRGDERGGLACRESNRVAAGGAAAGGTGIVSAVRVAFPAGLQQCEHLGLSVVFGDRIGHFARDDYKESLSQEIADKTVPTMKVRSETRDCGEARPWAITRVIVL